jgi:hypothetical protein
MVDLFQPPPPPPPPNSDSLENTSNHFDLISVVYGHHLHKYNCADGIFKKIMVHALLAECKKSVLSKPAL